MKMDTMTFKLMISILTLNLVETRGVEPLSETLSSGLSPGAVSVWSIPLPCCPLTNNSGPVACYTIREPGSSHIVFLFNLPPGKVCYLTPVIHPADRMG